MAGTFTPATGADLHYRGTTDGGPPAAGQFALGDWVETPTGIALCQVGGIPGIWSDFSLTGSGSYAPTITAISGETPTATTARLNAALLASSAYGVRKTVTLVGDFTTNGPLVIQSKTVLDARSATITLDPSVNDNILTNQAVDNPQRTITDGAINVGTSAVTLNSPAQAAFTSADVGRSVNVPGAGPGGIPFTALITAIVDANNATLDTAATTTVSAATVPIYTRDTDITILGGLWTKFTSAAIPGGRTTRNHTIFLRHLDDVTLDGVKVQTSLSARYSITLGDVTGFKVHRIFFPTARSDGVHITGPAKNGSIRDISGSTGDDMVALCTTENNFYIDTAGAITDVLVDSSRKYGTATTGNALKLAGYAGVTHDRIEARNLWVENPNAFALALAVDTGGLDIGTLTVDGVFGAAYISGGTIKFLDVRNVTHGGTVVSQPWINVQNAAAITRFSIRGAKTNAAAGTGPTLVLVQNTATIARLTLDDIDLKGTTSPPYLVQLKNTANVTLLHITKGVHDFSSNGGGFVDVIAGTLGVVKLSDCHGTNSSWLVAVENAATVLAWVENCFSKGSFFLSATANLTVRGAATFTTPAPSVTAGGVLRIIGLGLQTDLTNLAKNNGDMAYNTNAAVSPGVGPVVCDGTTWRLATIAAVKSGTAVLVAGTVTVADTAITANSIIRLSRSTIGGVPGALYVSALTAATSFAVTSTNAADTSTVYYEIVKY